MGQQLLVTGGAGFIGSNLVDALLAAGHDVTVLDDLSTGRIANLAHLQENRHFHFVRGSVLDVPLVQRLIEAAEAVYHLAAVVGVKHVLNDPLHGMLVNVQGTENILAAAARRQCKVLIVSSSEVYGKSMAVPFAEDDDVQLGSSMVPRWSYALSKLLDEHLALAYHRQRGLPVVAVRYFNAYGPRLDPNGYGSVVARFVMQALTGQPLTIYGSGQQTRCFTYVADTVRGTIAAMTEPAGEGRVFNIGNDGESTIETLAQKIQAIAGVTTDIIYVPYTQAYGAAFEETQRRWPDNRCAREILHFAPSVTLDEGLRYTIRWFEEHFDELI